MVLNCGAPAVPVNVGVDISEFAVVTIFHTYVTSEGSTSSNTILYAFAVLVAA